MSIAIILPDAKVKELRELLFSDGEAVIIIPESIATKHDDDDLELRAECYDHGGEADLWVDFADYEEHSFYEDE